MRCPTCSGLGNVMDLSHVEPGQKLTLREAGELMERSIRPCPTCHGARIIHCCEGEQCQPEKDRQ